MPGRPAKLMHLRRRKGGPICGARGPAVRVTALDWYARLRTRRCPHCWRLIVEYLAGY